MGMVAVFLSPLENNSDAFQENLNIIIQDLSEEPMTLAEYTELSIGQAQEYRTDETDFDSIATTLDGIDAHKITYTGYNPYTGQTLKHMQVWTIKDNTAYILTYTAEIDKYNNFLDDAQEMINSFEII